MATSRSGGVLYAKRDGGLDVSTSGGRVVTVGTWNGTWKYGGIEVLRRSDMEAWKSGGLDVWGRVVGEETWSIEAEGRATYYLATTNRPGNFLSGLRIPIMNFTLQCHTVSFLPSFQICHCQFLP